MLRHVPLVRTDVSEERSASIFRVTRIGELGTLEVSSNRSTQQSFSSNVGSYKSHTANAPDGMFLDHAILVTLMTEALSSSETSVLTRATRCNIPEGGILHSQHCEDLKSYISVTGWAL
jgi:hypothetical protein